MTESDCETEERTDRLRQRTDDRHRIGIDAKGRAHYADAVLGTVWVTADGEIVHIEQTDDIAKWADYTREHVGWRDCSFSTQRTSEWLIDELTRIGVA